MGSVKDLVRDDSVHGKLYQAPTLKEFGQGVWRVKGTFSVKDLKKEIPETHIQHQPEALTMMTAAYFEHLAESRSQIPTCYLGVVDKDGKITDTSTLLARGETTNHIAMRLANTPDNLPWNNDLKAYRADLRSGDLQCGVADVESIFRQGLPLGSSTFKRIFAAVGMQKDYESLATYDEVVAGLDRVREAVARDGMNPKLERILRDSRVFPNVPNPGLVLNEVIYDSTTKFESAGDRVIDKAEERLLSGLSDAGYEYWVNDMFPQSVQAQIRFAKECGLLNIDGKKETVSYKGMPVITDFAMTMHENRLMIVTERADGKWAVPTNKEFQRALFTRAGVDGAISEAKRRAGAENSGNEDNWRQYFGPVAKELSIDVPAISEHSSKLMANASGEVGNRVLGRRVFDVPPLDTWIGDFMPYASKIQQQAA